MNYKTDMNSDLEIFQAKAFQAVANDLHTRLNSLSNPKTYKSTDEGTILLAGYSASIVVLRALAYLTGACFSSPVRSMAPTLAP